MSKQTSHSKIVKVPSLSAKKKAEKKETGRLGKPWDSDHNIEADEEPMLPDIKGIMKGENLLLNTALDTRFGSLGPASPPIRHEI